MFKSSNVMIKEWVLRSIELNQYSFLLALFCPQKVGFFHSRSHRWGLWCCRSHSRPHRWMLWCWDEACLGRAWVQSPIEAEIVIWWPCARLDRSAWHSIRFGSVDRSRVCALVDSWVRTRKPLVELESSWTPVSYSIAPWIGGVQCVFSWHRDLWVPPVGQSNDIPVGG
jgi:hypothetical protein